MGPGNHHPSSHLFPCDCSKDFMWVGSDGICPSASVLCHPAPCPPDPTTQEHVSEYPFLLRMNSRPLNVCTTFSLSTRRSMDTRVASTFCSCDKCYYKHGFTNISLSPCFQFFWVETLGFLLSSEISPERGRWVENPTFSKLQQMTELSIDWKT